MASTSDIRQSTIAGMWYPGEPDELRALIDELFAQVPEHALTGPLHALIAPHAGYRFSGSTAAYAYKQVIGERYEAVIVLGPSHYARVGEYAISAEDAYQTPLGVVPIHEDLVNELMTQLPSFSRVREPLPTYDGPHYEHSIELQLPFLQVALGAFTFVPVLMNADTLEACVALGQAIAAVMRNRQILLVASSDFNHLNSYYAVRTQDAEVVSALRDFKLAEIAHVLLDDRHTVCGRGAILAASASALALGANHVEVLAQTNSGDVTGRTQEGQYTVGYVAMALTRG
jgi:AmmeMemoRadiSam system protein B